ncbi:MULTISPECIES: fimbria/pilus outer membrane usher protein [unclassified Pseudomonas]|uniref:fimbria/pilus outer membrane usher protein n=1 Tax=unclassified Pseudomonas TaxID=196821 RepID=UPI002AC97E37|nr:MULTISPECIES: fimbria/pilus outer membrane usher protein [unclassified Pseudomonas]MEB0043840.1 fimbria/pilus outer membrane usher protein [Pseudomonas sp. Dout3]MEB0095222.1 fimbria/pilus outer membrane usher protein [Pseudomonas sp. DC1.2]WPX58779.1 fimbria/pilus outer membrane usher protein [Pseudomonas sp. DC1.2]
MSRDKLRYGCLLLMGVLQKAWSETLTEFDYEVLETRGIDPKVAEHFRTAPRFQAGASRVSLLVNGAPAGQVLVTFDGEGQLCIDANLLDQAGIAAPSGLLANAEKSQCLRVIDGLAGVQVRLDPGQQRVGLLVPTDQLLEQALQPRTWATGGMAGLFNYDALVVSSSNQGQSSQYRSLGSEVGFNAGGWVIRSRQNYTSFQGVERFETLYTQASRTWEPYAANVQLGQLNMSSTLFAGGPFTGLQITPETALDKRNGEGLGVGTVVEGLAYSPSRIEVRQSGVVIYTTLVPGGPFTLRDLPLISHQLDLEVTIFEEGGERRQWRVSPGNFRPANLGVAAGYGIAAGTIRRFADDQRETPSFFAISKDWRWWPQTQVTTGLLGANEYQSLGWGVQQALTQTTVVGVQQLSSRTSALGQGRELQVNFSTSLGPRLSASLTASQRNQAFRTLADTGATPDDIDLYGRAERQWGGAMSYSDREWGAFTGTFTRYASEGGKDRSRIGASWSRAFSEANLSLSIEREEGGDTRDAAGTGVYASLSVPLGRSRSLNTYVRHDDRRGQRSGARYNEQVSETLGYSLAAERNTAGQTDFNGRISALPRYTRVDVGYARTGAGSSSHDLTLRGGVALHEGGLTASPYALRDTFGVLKAGQQAGIKLSTPQGPVWTDAAGQAVAASLPAYQVSRLEIDTLSLPRNTAVLNGYQEIEAGRGAVPRIDFALSTARQVMLRVRTVDGKWVPKGVSVYDNQGQYLTTVVDAGVTYLADAPRQLELLLALPGERRCLLELQLLDPPATTAPYETVDAVCR